MYTWKWNGWKNDIECPHYIKHSLSYCYCWLTHQQYIIEHFPTTSRILWIFFFFINSFTLASDFLSAIRIYYWNIKFDAPTALSSVLIQRNMRWNLLSFDWKLITILFHFWNKTIFSAQKNIFNYFSFSIELLRGRDLSTLFCPSNHFATCIHRRRYLMLLFLVTLKIYSWNCWISLRKYCANLRIVLMWQN